MIDRIWPDPLNWPLMQYVAALYKSLFVLWRWNVSRVCVSFYYDISFEVYSLHPHPPHQQQQQQQQQHQRCCWWKALLFIVPRFFFSILFAAAHYPDPVSVINWIMDRYRQSVAVTFRWLTILLGLKAHQSSNALWNNSIVKALNQIAR